MSEAYTIDRRTAADLLKVSVRTIDRYLKKGTLRSVKRDRSVYILKDDLVREMRKKDLRIPLFIDPKIKTIASGADERISKIVDNSDYKHSQAQENYPDKTNSIDSIQAKQNEAVLNPPKTQNNQIENQVFSQTEPKTLSTPDQYPAFQGNIVKESTRLEDRVADSLDFYKNLYEVTKSDLDDKVQQLNKLTFRLGQLETQVQSSIPLLEYKKQEKLLSETTSRYQEALNKARLDAKHSEALLTRQINEKERDLAEYAGKIKDIKRKLHLEEKNKHVFAILTFLSLSALPIVWLALK